MCYLALVLIIILRFTLKLFYKMLSHVCLVTFIFKVDTFQYIGSHLYFNDKIL